MKKLNVLLLFWVISQIAFAQQIQNIEYDYTDGNGHTCKSNLYINGKESLFTISDTRVSGDHEVGESVYKVHNDKWSRIFYDNGTLSLTRIPLYGKELLYQSSAEAIKTTGKSKIIGKFQCQEAIVAKGGRNYQVWFAPSVPVGIAPLGIDKLPGLAVEIQEIGGEKTHLKLIKTSNGTAPVQFLSHRKYILGKKNSTYDGYKKEITKQVTGAKKENNVAIAELLAKYNVTGGGIEFSEDQRYYTCHLVDIPENLVKDLQKIK